MKVTVLGLKPVNFEAKDGRQVVGTTMYIAYDENGVDGMVTDKIFVAAEKMPKGGVAVGADLDLAYNKYGKVAGVAAYRG